MKETHNKEVWVQMEHKTDGQKSGGKIKKKKEVKVIFSTILIPFPPSVCFSALSLHHR